jgi:hypothetical protein
MRFLLSFFRISRWLCLLRPVAFFRSLSLLIDTTIYIVQMPVDCALAGCCCLPLPCCCPFPCFGGEGCAFACPAWDALPCCCFQLPPCLDCSGGESCCFLPIITCFALDRLWGPAASSSNKNNASSFENINVDNDNNRYIPLDVFLEIEQASTTSSSRQSK